MRLLVAWIVCLGAISARAQEAASKASPAVAEIIRQFHRHAIVMLGEIHGSIQFDQMLKDLVTTPAFAEQVNDIVLESGNALHQPALDRYVQGFDVPMDQLRPVWQDVVGAPGGT